eukprot:4236812-Pyramimonas_sp.AAC.1
MFLRNKALRPRSGRWTLNEAANEHSYGERKGWTQGLGSLGALVQATGGLRRGAEGKTTSGRRRTHVKRGAHERCQRVTRGVTTRKKGSDM